MSWFRVYTFLLVLLLTSGLSLAKLDLYKLNSEYLFPDIYIPNKVINVSTLDQMVIDLSSRTDSIPAYVVDEIGSQNQLITYANVKGYKYMQVSPESYLVYIPENFSQHDIILNQSFHGGWDIFYLPRYNYQCSDEVHIDRFAVDKCLDPNVGFIKYLALLFFEHRSDVTSIHYQANGIMNGWHLEELSKGTYLIHFRVQNHFYLGILISTATFFIFLSYLLYNLYKSNFKK